MGPKVCGRISFACGGRALRPRDAAWTGGRQRSALSVLAGAPAAIERVQAESKDLRRNIMKFQEVLAGHEAARLLSRWSGPFGLDDYPGGATALHIVVEALDGWDGNGLKAIASAIT